MCNSSERRCLRLAALVVALAALAGTVGAVEELTVIGFNLESGDARIGRLGDQIGEVAGCDIWGFSEVQENWEDALVNAAKQGENANFTGILGTTGGADRLMVVYNADKLEYREHQELHHLNWEGRVRSPLIVRFRMSATGQEFWFMVNHLYRSRAGKRHEQADGLNEWARTQSLPVIAVGDYNFDWSLPDGTSDHDEGFDLMVADQVFAWVQPEELVKTQCSGYNSVLDFVFSAGAAQSWQASSEILLRDPDYCPDDHIQSDHRPVRATFSLAAHESTRALLLQRIAAIEEGLHQLKQAVEQLPP